MYSWSLTYIIPQTIHEPICVYLRIFIVMMDTMTDHTASVENIRRHFPALQRQHNGRYVAYFDGPGGTQVPREVVRAMSEYLYNHNANTHWAYPTSHETDRLLDDARHTLADYLNVDADSIAFGNNMTTITMHVGRALAGTLTPGDEIIVTDLDHHANIDPWHRLARERRIRVAAVRFHKETGVLDWDHFEQLLSARTRIVAIGAASNALGTINDVKRACTMARSVKALSYVDAVHYAAHFPPDIPHLECNLLACSPYKFYGPHAGVLGGKRSTLEALDFPRLRPTRQAAPEHAETGTQNHEGIIGSAAAVNFLASLSDGTSRRQRLENSAAALHARAHTQLTRLWTAFSGIDGVTLYGPKPDGPRTATIAFTVRGLSSEEVCRRLADEALFLSHGDFYATTVTQCLGVEGLVRAGCACYTTDEEIDRLIRAVSRLLW